jgi:formylglycine-generating enzyme required for sulfatase activity
MKLPINVCFAFCIYFLITSCSPNSRSTSNEIDNDDTVVIDDSDSSSSDGDNSPNSYTNSFGIQFNYVEAGTFIMGAEDGNDNEKPIREVELTEAFYLGIYEVTQAQWFAVMGISPSFFTGDSLPVERVSWQDVQAFIAQLNEIEGGSRYRLPSEAEWEYAAKGGQASKSFTFAGSDSINNVAWYNANSSGISHKVGLKQPNELGIYDMSGNVWEWCQDWFDAEYYEQAPNRNPEGPSSAISKVIRGGSWGSSSDICRTTNRGSIEIESRFSGIGFRLLRAYP